MIVDLCRHLQTHGEYVLSKQLIRSGTSIGANVEESVSAESRKDFSHKLNIALKEAREAHYWLRLLGASQSVPASDLADHLAAADEIVRLLAAITKRLRGT